MSPDFLKTAVVYDLPLMRKFTEDGLRSTPSWYPDFDEGMWISETDQELNPELRGIIFKFPNWSLGNHKLQEMTLTKMAFKASSLLIDKRIISMYIMYDMLHFDCMLIVCCKML